MVKRLRHQPLTLKTWVRFPYGSPTTESRTEVLLFLFLSLVDPYAHQTQRLAQSATVHGFAFAARRSASLFARRRASKYSPSRNSRTCLALGALLVLFTLAVLIARIISSPANIPHSRYAPKSNIPMHHQKWCLFLKQENATSSLPAIKGKRLRHGDFSHRDLCPRVQSLPLEMTQRQVKAETLFSLEMTRKVTYRSRYTVGADSISVRFFQCSHQGAIPRGRGENRRCRAMGEGSPFPNLPQASGVQGRYYGDFIKFKTIDFFIILANNITYICHFCTEKSAIFVTSYKNAEKLETFPKIPCFFIFISI